MIGIGVTTYGNRPCAEKTLKMLRMLTPAAKIVVVDKPGIPEAKNACLKLLDDCDHIFLFDDDCYPTKIGWYVPYVQSEHKHLCYTFNRKVLKTVNGVNHYELPSGCMLYVEKSVLSVVGGFDTEYKGYAYEHVDWSQRIFNAGLTEHPFMDFENSSDWIHSMDEHKEVETSVGMDIRIKNIGANRRRLKEQIKSKEFKAYK